MVGRPVVRERLRSVWLGGTEVRLVVARESRGIGVRFLGEAQGGGAAGSGSGEGPAMLLASAWRPGEPVWHGTIDGQTIAVQVRPILNGFILFHRGIEARAFVYTESESAAARLMPVKIAADTSKKLLCPMPGLVVAISVVPGQEVKAGETLAIVEAMKMENVLRAERDGTVKAIFAKKGDSLAVDAVILEFA